MTPSTSDSVYTGGDLSILLPPWNLGSFILAGKTLLCFPDTYFGDRPSKQRAMSPAACCWMEALMWMETSLLVETLAVTAVGNEPWANNIQCCVPDGWLLSETEAFWARSKRTWFVLDCVLWMLAYQLTHPDVPKVLAFPCVGKGRREFWPLI